jgi:hypothetical protein
MPLTKRKDTFYLTEKKKRAKLIIRFFSHLSISEEHNMDQPMCLSCLSVSPNRGCPLGTRQPPGLPQGVNQSQVYLCPLMLLPLGLWPQGLLPIAPPRPCPHWVGKPCASTILRLDHPGLGNTGTATKGLATHGDRPPLGPAPHGKPMEYAQRLAQNRTCNIWGFTTQAFPQHAF